MFKSIFYLINTIFAIFYLFPGSILGYLLYKNFNKQPQLTDDFNFLLFNFSSNHVFAFLILSFLGFLLFYEKKRKSILLIFFRYLFSMNYYIFIYQTEVFRFPIYTEIY